MPLQNYCYVLVDRDATLRCLFDENLVLGFCPLKCTILFQYNNKNGCQGWVGSQYFKQIADVKVSTTFDLMIWS